MRCINDQMRSMVTLLDTWGEGVGKIVVVGDPYTPNNSPGSFILHIQGVSKKMVFSGKMAISTFKLIQIANVGGVLENSGNLLHYGYLDFQNGRRND